MHVQLAQEDASCVAQPAHDGRVLGRDPVREDPRARRRTYPRRVEEVLHSDGDAVQRPPVLPRGDLTLGGARLLPREIGGHRDERSQTVEGGGPREGELGELDGRYPPLADEPPGVFDGEAAQLVGHARMLGRDAARAIVQPLRRARGASLAMG